MTVKIVEPILIVPLLSAPEFEATWNATGPLPVPDPEVTVIQFTEELAVHGHCELVVTLKPPTPPDAAKLVEVKDKTAEQPDSCTIVNV